MLKIYTDGSCKGNGMNNAVGAWAYIILDENDEIVHQATGAEYGTTNNRMEMSAVLSAIDQAFYYLTENETVEIYTDSAYIHNCLLQKWYENWEENGWINSKKEVVKNKDLWLKLIKYFRDSSFSFYKVKGHSTDKWNNYVDYLAQSAADGIQEAV